MGLTTCKEVGSKLKGFMAETNRVSKAKEKPFSGHGNATSDEMLDMVTAYCIQKKLVVIQNAPPLTAEGVQKLFPENVVTVNIV